MATSYSANQYDNAFVPKYLQTWQVPKETSARPKKTNGTTVPIATIDGRLTVSYNRENAHKTNYINTWDLPKHLPGSNIDNPTARDRQAYDQLHKDYADMKLTLTGKEFNYRPGKSRERRVKLGNHSGEGASKQTSEPQARTSGGLQPLSNGRTSEADHQDEERLDDLNAGANVSNKIPLPDFSLEEDKPEKLSAL